MNAPITRTSERGEGFTGAGVDSPCGTAVLVPPELERRLREAVARCAATLGESPERCRRAVEIAVLQRGIEALEKGSERL